MRTALFATVAGTIHLRLFDGRPGSELFPGVTPSQAASNILQEHDILWGCFLDPGQTSRLVVNNGKKLSSYGNRHYLRWPKERGEKFIWVPDEGRPIASMLSMR